MAHFYSGIEAVVCVWFWCDVCSEFAIKRAVEEEAVNIKKHQLLENYPSQDKCATEKGVSWQGDVI